MVLLTSGQVSVAISSVVVFLFTSALFLSGYVLQQQTVRDLREAIKPQFVSESPNLDRLSQPKLYLQKQFDLDGDIGDVVTGKSGGKVGEKKQEIVVEESVGRTESGDGVAKKGVAKEWEEKEQKVLAAQKGLGVGDEAVGEGRYSEEEEAERQGGEDKKANGKKEQQQMIEEKTLSRAERRRKIKEEIMAAGEGENKPYMEYRRRRNSY
ncbi:hypothetical protein ACMFMG_002285 [Clarireedia jacksonii]